MKEAIANVINLFFEMIFGVANGITNDAIVTFDKGYNSIWELVVNAANTVIEPIAAVIVLTFFLLSMVDKVTGENFTLERVVKELMKLFIGLYLVTNATEIVVMLIEFGNGIISSFMEADLKALTWTYIKPEQLGSGNVFSLLLVSTVFLIVGVIQLFIFLLMKIVALARILDIAIRTAVSPIALSDAFSGNFLTSNAMNFMRSFLAVCLQGAFIYIIAHFTPALMAAAIKPDVVDIWKLMGTMCQSLAISGASLFIMFKSGSIAKEVLGAR